MGNTQAAPPPLNNFNSSTTAEQAAGDVDLKGKNFLITGGNTGIGKETARVIAQRGGNVFLGCRDAARCAAAANEIKELTKNENVHPLSLDLADLASVRSCAKDFLAQNLPLHCLINNAGVMALPERSTTKDGFETQFGVNHLGHFLLTSLLLDKLKESSPSRIVVVSSRAHENGHLNFDDLNCTSQYQPFTAYSQSKLANVVFANELSKRLKGTGVTVNSLHPGVIPTELGRYNFWAGMFYSVKFFFKTIEQGAATTVYLATSPQVEGISGEYFSDCNPATPNPEARDEAIQAKLWKVSEELVGGI